MSSITQNTISTATPNPLKGIYSLPPLKDESKRCLINLALYKPSKSAMHYPLSRRAAVLVALFVGRQGDLYVLLSRRSDKLHSYPGDTSLPGGKYEQADRNIEDTARREAFEEIGLSLDKRKIPLLCTLEPFLARNQLIVSPVVVLILDRTFRPVLNELEVHSLFSHPLFSFLQITSPRTKTPQDHCISDNADTEDSSDTYYTYTDVSWKPEPHRSIRLHRFLTGRENIGVKPIFGLTAAILIKVSSIGYSQEPEFDVETLNQPTMEERIEYALRHDPEFLEALEEEERNRERQWLPARRSIRRRISRLAGKLWSRL